MPSSPTEILAKTLSAGIGRNALAMAAVGAVLASTAVHAIAARVNFAKYQKVTASSHSSTYRADFATDGIVSNFHSFRTGTSGSHSLEISWPRPVTLASAHLYLGLDNVFDSQVLQNFKFQHHDGTDWIDVPGSSVSDNTQTEVNLIFGQAVTAARFRLWTNNTGSRIIREVAMFPPNPVDGVEQGYPIGTDVRLSLAHQRPAEGSTIGSNGYPKLAVDGYVDDASRWISLSQAGQSMEINLLVPHVIGSAHLYTGLGATLAQSDFKLQSWDGTSWVDIPGATIIGNTSNSLVIPFSSNVTTSRVRLVNNSSSATRVKELLVFPPRAGDYPLGQDVNFKAPPTTTWAEFEENTYELRSASAELRLLGFYDGGVRFSAGLQTRDALGWQLLLNHRDGSYRVRHQATGQCLALSAISSATNNPVILEDYSGMPHQDWFLQKINTTQFRILNLHSGLALQVGAGDTMVVAPVNPTSDLQLWHTQNPVQPFKKGIAASSALFPNSTESWIASSWPLFNAATTTSWTYSWGRQTAGTFPFIGPKQTFHPMQWSGNMNHGLSVSPIEYLRRELNSSPKPAHVMGFNEPEHATQGNVTVDDAIALWPRLEALGLPLVAPAPASAFQGWLADFSTKANARGLRRDYTAVHWYGGPNATNLINHLEQNFTTFGRPVWLTEFGPISWTGSGSWTKADNYNFLAEFMWRAESLAWLKKYSLFQFEEGRQSGTDDSKAPRGNSRKSDGSLTAFGELYAGWDSVTQVLPQKVYHVHNRSAYRRLRNPAAGDSTVSSTDPDVPSAGTQWFLTPGITANTYRLVSRRDGRQLRFFEGVPVGMAPASTTTGQVEWRLAADQHGWFSLEHPQSNKRLKDNGNGTFTMGVITSTADDFKWRFVVPAAVENVAPVLAAIPPRTVDKGVLLTFTASTTDADLPADTLVYSLVGAPAGASIHASTGVFTWTPTATGNFNFNFNFTVCVSDGALNHDQPVSVTVVSPFPGSEVDTDGDGLSDLLEFAFGTDPEIPNGNPFRIASVEPGTITLGFPWNWSATGLSWQLRHGEDLADIAAWPVVPPGPTTITREGDIDRVSVSPSRVYPNRGFYVLEALGN